jgi:hypothetical protein
MQQVGIHIFGYKVAFVNVGRHTLFLCCMENVSWRKNILVMTVLVMCV